MDIVALVARKTFSTLNMVVGLTAQRLMVMDVGSAQRANVLRVINRIVVERCTSSGITQLEGV